MWGSCVVVENRRMCVCVCASLSLLLRTSVYKRNNNVRACKRACKREQFVLPLVFATNHRKDTTLEKTFYHLSISLSTETNREAKIPQKTVRKTRFLNTTAFLLLLLFILVSNCSTISGPFPSLTMHTDAHATLLSFSKQNIYRQRHKKWVLDERMGLVLLGCFDDSISSMLQWNPYQKYKQLAYSCKINENLWGENGAEK